MGGIESRAEVCGGYPCIVRTRIPVWVLEQAKRLGASEADLLRSYPTLRAEDLVNAWAYVRAHRDELAFANAENRVVSLSTAGTLCVSHGAGQAVGRGRS